MYTLGPAILVKGENNWPEYQEVLRNVQERAIARASDLWNGYTFGGSTPGDKEFGMIALRPNEMASDVSATTLSGSYTFRKNITAASAWRNLFDYSVRDDVIHAFAGFAIPEDTLRMAAIRMEIGDRIYPINHLEEALGWGSFAILFKQKVGDELIAEPRKRVLVKSYHTSIGWQTVIPLGFELFRRKDLVITET